MNPLIPLYVTLRTFVQDRVERLQNPEDRGAGVVEYAALLVLAGALIVALLDTDIIDTLKEKVEDALDDVFSAGD
ncbi:hypothetical protein [Actinocorallia aurantiaca]|uniref:Pilus assembly protein Flp/PilA n=1 Tax=Actinocorallia aurantiaca TaxID=46204 RepID=A0ABN3U349_9ACTN